MFERFTDRARKVLALANQEAQRLNHEYIGTGHILLGLVKEGIGVGATVLKNHDVDIKKLRLEVEKLVESGHDMVKMGKLPLTSQAKKVIDYAIEEARSLNHNYVGTEHILLGLLRVSEGIAAQVLINLGLKREDLRQEVLEVLNLPIETQKRDLKNLLTKELTRAERLIIVLYYNEKMTFKEIAAKLELSEARIAQMLSSIIARLKAQMKAMKGQRGKKCGYVIHAKRGLLNDTTWRRTLKDYPTSLICLIRERLLKEIPGLTEKFNTHSRYFGYWKGEEKDKAYIFVQKKTLCIHLCIIRDDYEGEICRAGFEIRYSHNFQGRAGWLTGWYVPHSTKNINVVVKYILKAFEGNP